MGKKSLRTANSTPLPGTDAMEQRAREYLAAGRYRKARDEIKLLCKIDHAKYMPLLIRANIGLAYEMLAKGQVSEAKQVLAYLKTISTSADWQALELELVSKGGDPDMILDTAIPLLADPKVSLTQTQRLQLADQVVVAFDSVPANGPGSAQLAAEVRAIHESLQAISAQQYEVALDRARPVGSDSAFAHWKLFIKGLVAFHRGDNNKAADIFRALPAGSTPARAAGAFLILTGGHDVPVKKHELSEPVIDAVCLLVGQPGLGHILWRAQEFWVAQRHCDSYKLMRDSIGRFPSEGLDLVGILSQFYFNSIFTLPEHAIDEYAALWETLRIRQKEKNLCEVKMILRVTSLLFRNELSIFDLKLQWKSFLQIHERLHGVNPRLSSLVYGWLGEGSAQKLPQIGFASPQKSVLRDPDCAIESLQKSIAFDSTNLAAHLELCRVYETLNMLSDRNRLLDLMTSRFPNDKTVLAKAGRYCLERKACVKGLDYLQRALQFDRLDPDLPDLIVAAQLMLARQYFQKGRADRARETLAQCIEHQVDDCDNLFRCKWSLLARHGLLEHLYGDQDRAGQLLAEAQTASPFPAAFLLFSQIAFSVYATTESSPSPLGAKLASELKQNPNAAHAILLLKIFIFWHGASDCPLLWREEVLLQRYLDKAARHPFTRDQAVQVISIAGARGLFINEAKVFIDKMLKHDPDDPLFRLYSLMSQTATGGVGSYPSPDEVKEIRQDAIRQGDTRTAALAAEMAGILAAMPLMGKPPVPPIEVSPFEDYSSAEIEEDAMFDDPSSEALVGYEDIISDLATLSDSEIRKFRKSMSRRVPNYILDQIIQAARGGQKPPKPSPPPISGPTQLDLFQL